MGVEGLSTGEQQPQEQQHEVADKIVDAFVKSGKPEDYHTLVEQAAANKEYDALGEAKARLDFMDPTGGTSEEGTPSDFIIDYLDDEDAEQAYVKAYDATLSQLKSESGAANNGQPTESIDIAKQVIPEQPKLDDNQRTELMRQALQKAKAFDPNLHERSEN